MGGFLMETITTIFLIESDKRTGRTYQSWVSSLNHWTAFLKTNKETDIKTVSDKFRMYLLSKCKPSSANLYWQKFVSVLHTFFELQPDQKFKIPTIKHLEAIREHLSVSEVKTLVNTFCASQTLKNMALFSCLTGLRFSDIQKLTFEDLNFNDGWIIRFNSQKTGTVMNHPISDQAKSLIDAELKTMQILGQKENGQIFNIQYSSYYNRILKNWIESAGITRKITFHCFRHSYACMQLEAGTDIFTVSKMLGHSDIKTTQIYAKIADKQKKETTNKIQIF